MSIQSFKIRREFLIPFGIVAGLVLVLLILACLSRGSFIERLVLAAIALPTILLFLEARNRTAVMTDQGILFRKFFRRKDILWDDISHVGCVIVRGKVYLLLTTIKGFFILSNAYGNFDDLIHTIIQHIAIDKVDEDVRSQADHPLKNRADIISLWIAVMLLLTMIVLKLLPA